VTDTEDADAEHAASYPWYRRPSRRLVGFGVLVVVYVAVTVGVIHRSPLLTLDTDLFRLHLTSRFPQWREFVKYYVMLGQRGPATLVFLPWFCWVAWRNRTPRPLTMLGAALLLLNLSVGVVKVITGRDGPLQTHNVHDVFVGGNIYPSGHVSNAVVLYGLVAMIAVNHRRVATAVAVFLSVTVGLATVYRDTHWFSDVIGGWIAGSLVLIALPWAMPIVDRLTDRVLARLEPRWTRWLASRRSRGAQRPPARRRPAAAPALRTVSATSLDGRHRHSVRVQSGVSAPRQATATPVSSVARSQSRSATGMSFDAPDESTRRGEPRTSPIPSGP
jgi:membrane-associated phospholipid phosphatase